MKKQPKILVESYKAADQYDIQTWNLVAFPSGFVDSIRTESGIVAANGSISLSYGDYLILSGWAGHPGFGMRFRDVLFSFCGKVIGRAAVIIARPDVATAVHRNLERSGWTANFAADHLPRCEEQVLQAWDVAPIGINRFPLSGKTKISLTGLAEPVADTFLSLPGLLTPSQNGKAELKKITVSASALRLRKCADPSCDIVGHITAGQHDGYILEALDQWSLVQVGKAAGWASNGFLTIK